MAPHIRIGLDTAHYSESGGDTAHNTIYYSESGGTPHKKMCSDIFTGVGTPHITLHTTQNQGGDTVMKSVKMFTLGWGHRTEFKERGGGTAQNQSRLLGGWVADWLAGWFNDYSANPGSIL